MLTFLRLLGKHAAWLLPVCLVTGFFTGTWFAWLGNWLAELILLLLAISLLDANTTDMRLEWRRSATLALGLPVLLIGAPVLAHFAALSLHLTPTEHAGLVLMLCAPPVTASGNMARLAGTRSTPSTIIMLVASLMSLVTVPWVASLLLPFGDAVDTGAMVKQLAYIVGGGIGVALLVRLVLPAAVCHRHARELDGMSALLLALFLFGILSAGAAAIVSNPFLALRTLAVAGGGALAMLVLTVTVLTLCRVSPGRTIAWGLCNCCRNMALVTVALPLEQAKSLFFYLVVVQVPIYLTPLATKLIHGLLLRRNPPPLTATEKPLATSRSGTN